MTTCLRRKNKECGDVYVSKCLLALILYLEQWCYNKRTKCIICLKGLVSSDRHWVQKQMTKGLKTKGIDLSIVAVTESQNKPRIQLINQVLSCFEGIKYFQNEI